jgi:hypothetical protein
MESRSNNSGSGCWIESLVGGRIRIVGESGTEYLFHNGTPQYVVEPDAQYFLGLRKKFMSCCEGYREDALFQVA